MNEDHKIEEALYFLNRLFDPQLEIREFSFELSAFLTAARSVLQYSLKEAEIKSKSNGKAWYDNQVKNHKVVKYLNEKRNISVHATPVTPRKIINIHIEERLGTGDFSSLEIFNPDGTIVPDAPQESVELKYALGITRTSSSSFVTYNFPDRPGSESVAELCAEYLKQVREIVDNGRALGFISQASI